MNPESVSSRSPLWVGALWSTRASLSSQVSPLLFSLKLQGSPETFNTGRGGQQQLVPRPPPELVSEAPFLRFCSELTAAPLGSLLPCTVSRGARQHPTWALLLLLPPQALPVSPSPASINVLLNLYLYSPHAFHCRSSPGGGDASSREGVHGKVSLSLQPHTPRLLEGHGTASAIRIHDAFLPTCELTRSHNNSVCLRTRSPQAPGAALCE